MKRMIIYKGMEIFGYVNQLDSGEITIESSNPVFEAFIKRFLDTSFPRPEGVEPFDALPIRLRGRIQAQLLDQ